MTNTRAIGSIAVVLQLLAMTVILLPAVDLTYHQQTRQYGPGQLASGNQSDPITRAAVAIKLSEFEGSTGGFWRSSTQHQADLVRKLYDELSSRVPEDYSIMIFNNGQENNHDLRDVEAWRAIKIGQFDYDVWLFKCGIVLNSKAARGFDNWTYGGQCWYTTSGGNKVHFQHPECPNYELRRMYHCGQHT